MAFARNFFQEEMWQKGFTYVALASSRVLCWNCGNFTPELDGQKDWACRHCHFLHKGTADRHSSGAGESLEQDLRTERDQARERVAVLERALDELTGELEKVIKARWHWDWEEEPGLQKKIQAGNDILSGQVENEQAPVL